LSARGLSPTLKRAVMIHHLEGRIVEIQDDCLIVEMGGVGVRVYSSRATREDVFSVSGPVKLYTYLLVREDEISLYGFSTPEERQLFEMLLSVSGIGPKVALAILSATTPQRLQEAILRGQADELAAIKGIGVKTAKRLILELKDKIAEIPLGAYPAAIRSRDEETALQALTQRLGFRAREARRAIEKAREKHGELPAEELIKRALERLSRS